MTLRIREMTPTDEEAYTRLLQDDPEAPIYASLPFRDFLADCVSGGSRYLTAWSGEDLVGALPLFISDQTILGRVANSLPWYGSHGGCLVAPGFEAPARQALLDALADLVQEEQLLSATVVMPLFEEQLLEDYVARLKPRIVDPRIGQVTELPTQAPDAEALLMKSFRYPAQVRKSLNQGFERIESDEDWAWRFLHTVHLENMQAVGGKAKPWEHFEALRRRLPAAWRSVSVALLNGEPVAALLLLYFNGTVEYFTPVIRHDYRPMQPLSFLIWKGMTDAMACGFRRWNWGGTWIGQKSLHHFKSGWGAQDQAYSYLTLASQEAVQTLGTHRDALGELFPYYFCYPFRAL